MKIKHILFFHHKLNVTGRIDISSGAVFAAKNFVPPFVATLSRETSSVFGSFYRILSSALFTKFCLRHFLPNFVTAPRCLFISFVTIAAISLSCYLSHNCHILPLFNSTFCRAPPILHGPCVRRYFSALPS